MFYFCLGTKNSKPVRSSAWRACVNTCVIQDGIKARIGTAAYVKPSGKDVDLCNKNMCPMEVDAADQSLVRYWAASQTAWGLNNRSAQVFRGSTGQQK